MEKVDKIYLTEIVIKMFRLYEYPEVYVSESKN